VTLPVGAPGPTPAPRRRRDRTDRITSLWLVLALVVMAAGLAAKGRLPQPLWTLVHVVTLGVLTNGIFQWSWYFARALLHLPPDHPSGRRAPLRVVAYNVVLAGLVVGMWTGTTWATVAGATLIGAVAAWHGADLALAARTRLASRFAVVIRYYVVAAGFLVLGCALAGLLTVAVLGGDAPAWLVAARDRLTLAHALVNVAGWVGLSIAGTLVTLGPTMLRTRMVDGAVDRAVRALPWLAGSVLGAATSAVLGWMPGVGLGLLLLAAAAAVGVALPLVRSALVAAPRAYPSWTMTAGLSWVVVALVAVAGNALTAPDATALREADLLWLAVLGAGGLAQVFVGALSYLMPVVIGGGPAAHRVGAGVLGTLWSPRVAVRNAALLLLAVGGSAAGPLRTAWWVLVLLCFVLDVGLQARARRAAAPAPASGGPRA
jgi:hypothetical protein